MTNALSFLGRTIVPDLDSPQSTPSSSRLSSFTHSPITSPYSSIGPSLTASPISPTRRPNGLDLPSRTNRLDSPSRTHMLNSPSRTNMLDPPILISPIPMTTKSFLDDDWLRDRVRFDAKMAQVAGGLVRSSSTPPRSDSLANTLGVAPNGTLFSTNFSNHVPPRDYVCKLCNIPGHWLKDCHLYEPRGGSTGTGKSSHSRTSSMSGVSSSRGQQPPGNYVCRLCGIPGHWIEQCAKFQPKFTKVEPGMKNCTPPINYICNLCNQPGHWIQQCSEFTPMPSFHRRSSPSDRGDFF